MLRLLVVLLFFQSSDLMAKDFLRRCLFARLATKPAAVPVIVPVIPVRPKIALPAEKAIVPAVEKALTLNKSEEFSHAVKKRTDELKPKLTEWMQNSAESKEEIEQRAHRFKKGFNSKYQTIPPDEMNLILEVINGRFNPAHLARVIAELEVRTLKELNLPLNTSEKLSPSDPKTRMAFQKAAKSMAEDLGRELAILTSTSSKAFNQGLYDGKKKVGKYVLDSSRPSTLIKSGEIDHGEDGHIIQQLVDTMSVGTKGFDKLMRLSADGGSYILVDVEGPSFENNSMWGIVFDSILSSATQQKMRDLKFTPMGLAGSNMMYPQGASNALSRFSILPNQ